ncbi:MAG TPA: MMPL family transporter, partial [Micromonosporaceae bacterium]
MFGKIAQLVTARPWFVVIAWLLAAAAIIGFSPRLDSITNSDQSAFLPKTAESAQAAGFAARVFPDAVGASAVIVATRADGGVLTSADVATLGQLTQRLNVDRPAAVRGVQFDPTQSISPNQRVGLLGIQFTGAAEDQAVRDAVKAVRTQTAAELNGTSLTAAMTGQAAVVVDNKQAFTDAEKVVTIVTVALIVVLLLLIFRSPLAALLPLLTVGMVFLIATSLTAAVGTLAGFEVGQELPTLLTVVLFGIGTDYILFLLFRYRERLRAGDTPRQAIVAAVERVGEAIFSAAFAVIAAFGALVLAVLGFFTTIGPALAIAVFVMLLAALTLVPAVVALLGRAVFWPSKPAKRTRPSKVFAPLGRFIGRRPAVVVAGTVVLLGGLAAGALTFAPDYDPVGQLPAKTEASQGFADLKQGFPAGALQPTQLYLSADRPLSQAEIG